MYTDLHAHLYGSFSPEELYRMGKNNPSPKWDRFIPEYEKVFNVKVNPDTFFTDFSSPEKFRSLYLMDRPGSFDEFQARFNLVIALSRFDEDEIYKTARQVVQDNPDTAFGEYRLMYSPFETDEGYINKTTAACEGLNAAGGENRGRLSLSLHRQGDYSGKYNLLKNLMAKNSIVNKYLTSIDFCAVEEGNPPLEKKSFFKQVLRDNKSVPSSSLAILYHVGESFQDKTPKSAVRWVIQSSELGAHRLGHCLALGLAPEQFRGKQFSETAAERKQQVLFEIQNHKAIRGYGEISAIDRLENELRQLEQIPDNRILDVKTDERYYAEIAALQEYGISVIKKNGSVVESCPTSNLYIGMINDIGRHPVKRFADSGVNLTIGTDDSGIFATSISKEYQLAGQAGLTEEQLEDIRKNSFNWSSEIISGRKES